MNDGGHRARKRFGQHFLHDTGVIRRILASLDPRAGERIVEIGPGLGALTWPLLERVEHLQAVELDRDVIARLRADPRAGERLQIHAADALRFDFAALAADGTPLRLIGNLPYNISTPLLFHLLGQAGAVRDMLFMLQKEVVDRLVAAPGSADYGRLTVMLAAAARAEALFEVGPGAFNPPPRVRSAVVRIVPRAPDFALPDRAAYARVVAAAFSQRRKQIGNALRGLLDAPDITACALSPTARAETLTPADYARLALRLSPNATPGAAQ